MKSKPIFLVAGLLLAYCVNAQLVTEKSLNGKWIPFKESEAGTELYFDSTGKYTYLETDFGKVEADSIKELKGLRNSFRQIEFKSNNKYEKIGDSPEKGVFKISENQASFQDPDARMISFHSDKTGEDLKAMAYFKEGTLALQYEVKTPDGPDYKTIWFKKAKK